MGNRYEIHGDKLHKIHQLDTPGFEEREIVELTPENVVNEFPTMDPAIIAYLDRNGLLGWHDAPVIGGRPVRMPHLNDAGRALLRDDGHRTAQHDDGPDGDEIDL